MNLQPTAQWAAALLKLLVGEGHLDVPECQVTQGTGELGCAQNPIGNYLLKLIIYSTWFCEFGMSHKK